MRFLLDTNILIDILTHDPSWYAWSQSTVRSCVAHGSTVINQIIYAELAPAFHTANELENALPYDDFEREDLPWEAAYLAGQCHRLYRQRGGRSRAPLNDFYIGAHAAVMGFTLVTRDAARYRTYFPRLTMIAPN